MRQLAPLLLALAACGSTGTSGNDGGPADAATPSDAGVVSDAGVAPDAGMVAQMPLVMVGAGGGSPVFSPNAVTIRVGDTVHWEWATSGHSVTSGTACAPDGRFCSPGNVNCPTGIVFGVGSTFDFKFTQAGTFPYFCVNDCIHGEVGTITVLP